jgi:tRNA(Arg) A34 adenosine deaminase TadA
MEKMHRYGERDWHAADLNVVKSCSPINVCAAACIAASSSLREDHVTH